MITILVDGKALDPKKAAEKMLRCDTLLSCPECEGRDVMAHNPKTIAQLPGEARFFVPRQQDRRCQACGHRWTVTLPPEIYAHAPNNR